MLSSAIVFITLALVFYSAGVLGEFRSKRLNKLHLGLFILGIICDTTGTYMMSQIAESSGNSNILHTITGSLALGIMAIHVIVAIIVLAKNNENALKTFHKFSIVAWIVWLVPYFSGMIISM